MVAQITRYPSTAYTAYPEIGPYYLDIRDFGAVPSTPDNKVDCSVAVNQAIQHFLLNRIRYDIAGTCEIRFPATDGFWYLTNTIYVNRNCSLKGAGSVNGGGASATRVVAASGVTAFHFLEIQGTENYQADTDRFGNPGPYGNFNCSQSVMQGFYITQENPVRDQGFGIFTNTFIDLIDIVVDGFGNDNIRNDSNGKIEDASKGRNDDSPSSPTASSTWIDFRKYEPSTVLAVNGTHAGGGNCFTWLNVTSINSLRCGIRCVSNNANAGIMMGIRVENNRGCGILTQSQHGDNVIGCLFERNGTVVANPTAGTTTVYIDGSPVTWPRLFICWRSHTASAASQPGVGADWSKYWYEFNKVRENFGNTGNTLIEAVEADINEYWATGTIYSVTGSLIMYNANEGGMMVGCNFMDARQGPARFGQKSQFLGGYTPYRKIKARTSENAGSAPWDRANVLNISDNEMSFLEVRNHSTDNTDRKPSALKVQPAFNFFMEFGNNKERTNADGTPESPETVNFFVYRLSRIATGTEDKGYVFKHMADANTVLLRFDKNGVKSGVSEPDPFATIKRLEDRIKALEANPFFNP